MKNILIILLGNRDIQISAKNRKELKGEYYSFFERNVDGGDFYVIDKKRENEQNFTFLQISELIWKNYEYFIKLLSFELFEKTLQVLQKEGVQLDKIIITTSNQSPRHSQDCYFIALSLHKYILDGGSICEIEFCEHNPNEFDKLVEFYVDIFQKYASQDNNLYISNTGGTPTMRSASHFAGLFQGYRYISISPLDENESKVYQKQENLVLRQIVQNMLNVHDYQGIVNLPVSEDIKDYCKYALNLYNFSVKLSANQNNFEEKARNAIGNLYWNMVICFRQGRYADVIGRIFRLEEAVGQYLIYLELKSKGIVEDSGNIRIQSDRTMPLDNFFGNRNLKNKIFTKYYPELFQENEKNEWYFVKQFDTRPTPIDPGKQFWYFFFKSLGKNITLAEFFERINNKYKHGNNPLVELRNKSILGHGVEGVNQFELESVTGTFEHFAEELKKNLENEINISCFDNFSPIHSEILECL